MSIVLKDGTVLPDFPEGFVTEKHPYAAVVYSEEHGSYTAYATPMVFVQVTEDSFEGSCLYNRSTEIYIEAYLSDVENEWEVEEESTGTFFVPLTRDGYEVVWSKYDIFVGVKRNDVIMPGSEIFFPSSTKPFGIALTDASIVPGIPTAYTTMRDKENAPDLAALSYHMVFAVVTDVWYAEEYLLVCSDKPFVFNASQSVFYLLADEDSDKYTPSKFASFLLNAYSGPWSDYSGDAWKDDDWRDSHITLSLYLNKYRPLWSDHIIRTVYDSESTRSDEIHFPVLSNGRVLQLPEGLINEERPCAAIFWDASWDEYRIFASASPTLYAPNDNGSDGLGITVGCEKSTQAELCYYGEEWSIEEVGGALLTGVGPDSFTFVWANHDIHVATDPTADNNLDDMIVTDKIYFHNSLAKPPFILPDGTELPALPDNAFDEYSCGAVFLLDDDMYILATTSAGLYLMPDGHWICHQDGYDVWSYDFELEAWGQISGNTVESFSTELVGLPEELKLLWTNTEVTDWSSGWFELSDGTKLPPPPDGCFDGTPYAVALGVDLFGNGELIYSMQTADKPFLALPATMLPEDVELPEIAGSFTHVIVIQPGTHQSFPFSSDEWHVEEPVNNIELEGFLPIKWTLWANHDVLYVTSYNADDGSYTIGTEIARKSDVNYRITEGWVRSIANETRRIGNISDGLTTDEMGETLRSIELSSGSVIDLPNAMEVSF